MRYPEHYLYHSVGNYAMTKENYEQERKVVLEIINLALESFKVCPPEQFDYTSLQLAVKYYSDEREKITNPESKFNNLISLNISRNEILTFFQEGSARMLNIFGML